MLAHAPALSQSAWRGGSSAAGRAPAGRRQGHRAPRRRPRRCCQLLEAAARTRQLETAEARADLEIHRMARSGLSAEQAAPASAAAERQACSGGALSLVQPGGQEQEVPSTLPQALATFASHPSTLLILLGLAALAHLRLQLPFHPAADLAVAGAVAAGWCIQEWAVHALLLHSKWDWAGRRIHVGHHRRPYFHVSIDDPPIVLAFMAASLGLFWALFGGSELALTASLAYYSMGLLYEFTHFIVHTRVIPKSRLAKRIRMHHLLHHTRHEGYWLAFTAPQVDELFGTNPDPANVRMSDMARQSLKRAREAREAALAGVVE